MKLPLLIINIVFILRGFVHAEKKVKEKEDPREALKNLGTFFQMVSGGNDTTCEYKCPEGSVPFPRKGHVPSSNGCGSMGIKLDTSMFPGFEVCCDKHDKCYDTCKTKRDKCDEEFNKCLDEVCERAKLTQSRDKVTLCENAGGVMQAAAKGLGCSAFKTAQKRACECKENGIEYDDKNNDDDDEDDDEDDDKDDDEDDDKDDEYNDEDGKDDDDNYGDDGHDKVEGEYDNGHQDDDILEKIEL